MKRALFFCLLIPFWFTTSISARVSLTFDISPASLPSDALGVVVHQIALPSAGGSVLVERFMDLNSNGQVDEGEPLIRRFTVTDGVAPTIGGVRNRNIPGDDDGAVNSAIRIDLAFPGIELVMGRMVGDFVVKVSSGASSVSKRFSVTAPNLPQQVTGTVLNASTRAPIPRAFVVVSPGDGLPLGAVIADASGNYSIKLPPGNYQLFGSAGPNFLTGGSEVTVTAGESPRKDIEMFPAGARIVGKLTDSTSGNPISSALVIADSYDHGVSIDLTDAEGNFRLGAQSGPGAWGVFVEEASAQQLGYLSGGAEVTVNSAQVTQNLALEKATALIYGTLTKSEGGTLPSIGIWADSLEGNEEVELNTRTLSPEGVYYLGVRAGHWLIGLEDAELFPLRLRHATREVTATTGQATSLNFVLEKTTAVVAGRVVTQTGVPVQGAYFHGHYSQNDQGGTGHDTLQDGSFEIPVWGGPWRFHLGDSDEEQWIESDLHLNITDGVDQRNIEYVVYTPNGQVQGSVKNSSNQGQPNVQITGERTIDGRVYRTFTETDANGNFSLPIYDYPWNIEVDCFDLQQRNLNCANSINVSASGQRADFIVTPRQSDAFLEGTIIGPNGPLPDVTIAAFGNGPTRQDSTDVNGNFRIGVTGGFWSLGILNGLPAGTIAPEMFFELDPGETIRNIQFVLASAPHRISGRITGANGQGVAGLSVSAHAETGSHGYTVRASTGSDGSYSLPAFNGSWSMWLDCNAVEQMGYDCPMLNAVNVQNQNVVRDIALIRPVAVLSGRVINEQGNPVTGLHLSFTQPNGIFRSVLVENDGTFRVGAPNVGPAELKFVGQGVPYIGPTLSYNVQGGVDISNIIFRMLSVDDPGITGILRTVSAEPLSGVGVYATATINGLTYVTSEDTVTASGGGFILRTAHGRWQIHFDCADLDNRGYECPTDIVYDYTPTSGILDVRVNPKGAPRPTLSNAGYIKGGSPIFRLRVNGSAGTYDIEESDTLNPGSWRSTQISVTINSNETFRDAFIPANNGRRYYRVNRR